MTPGTVEKIWVSLIQGLLSGCSVRMPGPGGAVGGRGTKTTRPSTRTKSEHRPRTTKPENQEPRSSSKPRRTTSSAASLQRDGPLSVAPLPRGAPSVVVTSYTQVDHELPPLPAPSAHISRTKSAPMSKRRERRELRAASPCPPSPGPNMSSPSLPRDPHSSHYSPTPTQDSTTSTPTLNTPDPHLYPSSDYQNSPQHSSPSPSSHSSSASSNPHLYHSTDYQNSPHHSPPSSSSASPPSVSPASASPSLCQEEDEEEMSCAICLELLHRPRRLPCGHTFCLLCLQNYVNTCRSVFSCPSCRGVVAVPTAGVAALPHNPRLATAAKHLRHLRQTGQSLSCGGCGEREGVATCGHCKVAWCDKCGQTHMLQVRQDIKNLRLRLSTARETMDAAAVTDEDGLRRLEAKIKEAVEERIRKVVEEGRGVTLKVQEIWAARESRSQELSHEIEEALTLSQQQQQQLCDAARLHTTLLKLLKATSTIYQGHHVTLDPVSLTLHMQGEEEHEEEEAQEDEEEEEEEEEDEEGDREVSDQDNSLMYRSKGSLSRARWGQVLGERPGGVAVSPWTSHVYVTGSDTCRVYMFDLEGRQLGTFGSRGHGEGQFLCPSGVAFSLVSRELYITDKWKHCIHVLDSEGRFLRQLGRKGKSYGHFLSPEGVTTDRHGRIYVADTCNNRVQVLDSDGVFLHEVGLVSSETLHDGQRYTKTEFNEPTGVAASLDGTRVYVADSGNHRVKVFDGVSGARLLTFGSRGLNKGQFESPECITVDPHGFILVGDSGNGRVQVFRPNGNFVRYLGTRKSTHGEFGWVSGLSLSRHFDVVVTDFKNNLVAVF